jgi:ATP-binding cassette subfamily F protein 1
MIEGKSTLLKFLAARRLPVPPRMSILLVEQEVRASADSVIDQVLHANARRNKLLAEEAELLLALETIAGAQGDDVDDNDGDNEDGNDEDGGAEDDGAEPEDETTVDHSSTSGSIEPDPAASEELMRVVGRIQQVAEELEAMGAHASEAKVCRILTGLGFSRSMQENSSMNLSGGWRMRVSLAKALFVEPHILLLDEPTNHLDLNAVLWLEDYLAQQWKGTLCCVSHDMHFLDELCTDVLHVDERKLNAYSGNVSSFRAMRHQIEAKKMRDWKLQQKTMKEFTSQGLKADKASKRTMEKLGVERLISEQPKEYRVKFQLPWAEDDLPSISVLDASFSYPTVQDGAEAGDKLAIDDAGAGAGGGAQGKPKASGDDEVLPMFDGLRFNISASNRIAIVGPNGTGKSTLLRLLIGRLEPTKGMVSLHSKLRLGVYNQHFEDLLPFAKTPLQFLQDQYSISETDARKTLGMFGLDGARHLVRIGELSGGQKARVVFANISLMRPHILILDEPTNHLDMETVDALIEALKVFQGGVVIVSHDARLITALECELWVCEGGQVPPPQVAVQGQSFGGLTLSAVGLRVENRGFDYYKSRVIASVEEAARQHAAEAELRARKRLAAKRSLMNKATRLLSKVRLPRRDKEAEAEADRAEEERKEQERLRAFREYSKDRKERKAGRKGSARGSEN